MPTDEKTAPKPDADAAETAEDTAKADMLRNSFETIMARLDEAVRTQISPEMKAPTEVRKSLSSCRSTAALCAKALLEDLADIVETADQVSRLGKDITTTDDEALATDLTERVTPLALLRSHTTILKTLNTVVNTLADSKIREVTTNAHDTYSYAMLDTLGRFAIDMSERLEKMEVQIAELHAMHTGGTRQ